MRFLFDENLSQALAGLLADIYPGSRHVREIGLAKAEDAAILDYARLHGFAVVTKDGDFAVICANAREPARVLWLRAGNCSTREIAALLRRNFHRVVQWSGGERSPLLVVRR